MYLGITAGYISTVMQMTPSDKAILTKATPLASGRTANALKSKHAWSCSVCYLGDSDTCAVLEHTVIAELVGH